MHVVTGATANAGGSDARHCSTAARKPLWPILLAPVLYPGVGAGPMLKRAGAMFGYSTATMILPRARPDP